MPKRVLGKSPSVPGRPLPRPLRCAWLPLAALMILALPISLFGCGTVDQVGVSSIGVTASTDDLSSPTTTATTTGPENGSITTESQSPPSENGAAPSSDTTVSASGTVDSLFAGLGTRLAPIPVYAPTFLPADASLVEEWWPVTEMEAPSQYSGPPIDNPRIDSVDGVAVSAQVVLQVGDGWLMFLDNFRGDLGDVTGRNVATVEGNQATGYDIQGGFLVQWSDGGRWYGVFGRNMDSSIVEKVVAGMVQVGPNGEISK